MAATIWNESVTIAADFENRATAAGVLARRVHAVRIGRQMELLQVAALAFRAVVDHEYSPMSGAQSDDILRAVLTEVSSSRQIATVHAEIALAAAQGPIAAATAAGFQARLDGAQPAYGGNPGVYRALQQALTNLVSLLPHRSAIRFLIVVQVNHANVTSTVAEEDRWAAAGTAGKLCPSHAKHAAALQRAATAGFPCRPPEPVAPPFDRTRQTVQRPAAGRTGGKRKRN